MFAMAGEAFEGAQILDDREPGNERTTLGAVDPRIVRIEQFHLALHQSGPRETLGDEERVVVECGEEFAENFPRVAAAHHAIELLLKLLAARSLVPVRVEKRRLAERVFDFRANCGIRHHGRKRRLGSLVVAGPEPVIPVDPLDGPLRRDAVLEVQLAGR